MMTVNKAGKGNRRFFAIVSLGKTRWYWVVWPSLQELQTSDTPLSHVAEGYEISKAQAVEKALGIAGMYAEWIGAKYAKAYHAARVDRTRQRRNRISSESPDRLVAHEFLYRDTFDTTTKQWTSVPHRVVRKTARYIYVEQQPYSPLSGTGGWLNGEQHTYRLDRQSLEENGYAFIPASVTLADQEEPLFFSYQREIEPSDQVPKCLEVLNLSWPCTVTEIQAAYRKLVRNAHPDGGGSHEKFLELQAAYEQAMQMCR